MARGESSEMLILIWLDCANFYFKGVLVSQGAGRES